MLSRNFRPSRRHLLAAAGASLTAIALPIPAITQTAATPEGFRILRARAGDARLRGSGQRPTAIWGYDGTVPGPTLRIKQGEELKVRLVNELTQPTVIHWHGQRLPNAMDGVPFLTQAPVAPGASFDYRFTPQDAGTFWYHTHLGSSEQMARGLYGVLIVDEPKPVAVDRDIVLVIDDWRLTRDGRIDPSFGNMHDAATAGRLGQYVTLNSNDMLDVPVAANERLRLRLINTSNARIFTLRFDRHAAQIMAVDGQPAKPARTRDDKVRLAPGARVDLFLDATLAPGSRAPILVDDLRGGEFEIGRLVYRAGGPARPQPLPEPAPLPANPLPERIDFSNALRLDVPIDGGMIGMMGGRGGMMGMRGMGPGMMGRGDGGVWTLAGFSSSGHDGPALFRIARGRTVVLTFPNRTSFPHAMHVHGHHFRQLDRNSDKWRPYWLDTVLLDVERTERIAFVADNPGKWLIHCHMLEHMESGMAAWFEVT